MWVLLIPFGLVFGAGFVALLRSVATRADASEPTPVDGGVVPSTSERQAALRRAIVAAGIVSEGWLRLLEVIAKHESDFNPRAYNRTDKERAAAAALAERLGTVSGIDFRDGSWDFGSKGLFQMLGAVVAVEGADSDRDGTRLRFPKRLTHPDMAFDPGIAVAAAFDFARGLMGWNNFAGTWASLLVGWKDPSKMGSAAALVAAIKSWEDLAAKLGWPRGWAGQQVDPLPNRTASENATLAEAANFRYKAG